MGGKNKREEYSVRNLNQGECGGNWHFSDVAFSLKAY